MSLLLLGKVLIGRQPEDGRVEEKNPQLVLRKARKLHGRLRWNGMHVSIENRKGSVRRGVDSGGKPWESRMGNPYGYFRRTMGMDGDHIDCFVGPDKHAEHVYIITTRKAPDFLRPDEQKVMINFASGPEAKRAFLRHYDDPRHFGSMLEMSVEEFKNKALQTLRRPMPLRPA